MEKSRIVLLVALCASLFTVPASSDVDVGGVVRIEIGKEKDLTQREVWRRVWMLERAVAQLQERVFQLEGRPPTSTTPGVNPKDMTTCYIRTPFNGTYTATEATETAARAKAIEACSAKASSIHCGESDVKCGK